MINTEDFFKIIDDKVTSIYKPTDSNTASASIKCYELAKQMAKDLLWFYANHRLDFQPSTPDRNYIGLDFKILSEEEIIELYIKSNKK